MDSLLAAVHRQVRRRLLFAGALAAACLASAGVRAQGDPPGRVGRVAEIAGTVRTVNPEGAWDALVRNQPLSTGDRISTDKSGRATLQFGSTTVRIGADSDLIVTQLDDQKIRLHFDHGQLAVRVRSDDILGELFIETDEGAWVPHHPGEYRFDRAAHQVLAAQAWSGDMLLEAPDSSLPLAAPQRAQVWRTGAQQTTHYRLVPAVKDAFGDAVLAADKADDKLSAASAAAQVPAEMTGAAELARYGAWSVAASGLHVWTPAKLPAGWAPYQQGAWSWNSPWGWTWVDDQPWGFAPFHYGRWLTVKGHWAWTPGQWGAARPVYAPALVGWFGGPALTVDGAPAVGWVALAPDEPVFPGYAVSARYWNALIDASVVPASRRPVAITGRARLVPAGAVAYANRAVPGASVVVGAAALLPHVPVATMPGPRGAEQRKPAFGAALDKATVLGPPPAPPGHTALAPTATVLTVPGVTPAPEKAGKMPILPAKSTTRVGTTEFAKPVPPLAVVPLVVARPVAPSLATVPIKPITSPLAPTAIAPR
ncbi:MAG: DUF6600 domain-containing protein [Vitreoscilla sp.]